MTSEEKNIDDRLISPQFRILGEFTVMEIKLFGGTYLFPLSLFSSSKLVLPDYSDNTSIKLLFRTSPMFKCALSYDTTLALADSVEIGEALILGIIQLTEPFYISS